MAHIPSPPKKYTIATANIFFTILITYATITLTLTQSFFRSSTPYYTYLLDALFGGRLNVLTTVTHDLSLYHGKWYMYWGPGPLVFITPFYLLGGIAREDVFYTLIAGLVNIGLFYFVLQACIQYFRVSVSYFSQIFLVLSFALASPNFYLTLTPGIWSTYQIIAITYVLAFLYCYFKVLLSVQYRQFYFTACSLFFTLAWLSRYTLIFYAVLFLPLLINFYRKNEKKFVIQAVVILGSITLVFGVLFGWYNYYRFGNPFETGFTYQVGKERSNTIVRNGKLYSLEYIAHNISYYYFNHAGVVFDKKPFFTNLSLEGNSVFSVYPTVLFIFFLFQKKYFQNKSYRMFLLSALVVIGTILGYLSVFFASGWDQFGNRFFFDVIPLLFLLLLFVLNDIPGFVKLIVLFYGIVVNMLGLLAFIYLIQGGKV